MADLRLLVIEPADEESADEELHEGVRLAGVLEYALAGVACDRVRTAEELGRYLERREARRACSAACVAGGGSGVAGGGVPAESRADSGEPGGETASGLPVEASEPASTTGRCACAGAAVAGTAPSDRLLFALNLGRHGINMEYYRILRLLRESGDALRGFTGGLIVDGDSALYTKSAARELVFTANCAGCAFVGRPLVEGTGTLSNFAIVAQNMDTDYPTAYKKSARLLVEEILRFGRTRRERPELLVLHASSHATSNTFALWSRVREELPDCSVTEIGLRNGTLSDCAGCPYKMCLHFGERGSCFYGGVMVEDVYPAVKKADAIVMLCPNYNDALSANLTAFINRLTALFRTTRFYDKALFAIVVSGYSGSDIVAEQLIAALNMNKTFYLPAHFALMETANNAGTAMKLPGIEERLSQFAARIRENLSEVEGGREC